MNKIFFIGGLGSNIMYIYDLQKQIQGCKIHYIDLPGHGLNYNVNINNLSDLITWFKDEIDEDNLEDITIIGHSLGADLLAYLSTHIKSIKNVILLDGGIFNLSELDYSIDDEIIDTQNFIKDFSYDNLKNYIEKEKFDYKIWTENIERATIAKVVYDLKQNTYKLNINERNVLNLLKLRRNIKLPLFNHLMDKNVLVLIPQEQPDMILKLKLEKLENNSKYKVISDCGHDIHVDNPKEVGEQIIDFISQ
ncbi:alpha/beta hydrolase [Macrococcus caseolyticus]|uniref:alpha/beta fold hydrolase n=1 Tax=Macrococcoides caseolyticum TaxID=69966 RepID=UPI0024BD38CC|nr:alpha/beta hydrolase [Macrococcus caseolyticus]MDJ1110501.1 alpha/beta hydrolase [Macrococcus caseolyticus]